MKKKQSLLVHVTKEGLWVEPNDFDQCLKYDSPSLVKKLRNKLKK